MVTEMEPLVVADVDKYVTSFESLRGRSGMLFPSIGAADLRNRLLLYIMSDLRKSRNLWQAMGMRENMIFGTMTQTYPPLPAVQVFLNKNFLEERKHPTVTREVEIGKEARVVIDINREFTRAIYGCDRNRKPL